MKVPTHVAIILDGNGRWAKSKGMPRNYGHTQGAKNVEVICEEAWNMGIKYLTVYAFSTENWNRPENEVAALMKLLRNYMKNCVKTAHKNHMRVRVIGDKSRLDSDIQKRDVYKRQVQKGLQQHPAFKGVGTQYIRFSMEEPKLFQLLFMSERPDMPDLDAVLPAIDENYPKILASVQADYGLNEDKAQHLYRHLWIYTHGIATLCATKMCKFSGAEISRMMTEVCTSLITAIQNMPSK